MRSRQDKARTANESVKAAGKLEHEWPKRFPLRKVSGPDLPPGPNPLSTRKSGR